MSHSSATIAAERAEKDWVSISFLTATPVIGILGTALYTWQVGFEWWMLGLCVTLYALVGMAICAGYHRFFSHKTYECAWPVQLYYAIFGAAAVQNSIAAWSRGTGAITSTSTTTGTRTTSSAASGGRTSSGSSTVTTSTRTARTSRT